MSGGAGSFRLEAIPFSALEGWSRDDPSPLFPVLRHVHEHLRAGRSYRAGALGLTSEDLLPLLQAAEAVSPSGAAEVRTFFERHADPFRIVPANSDHGFVTGFYEPDVEVSATPDAIWCHPFYRRPDDLADIDDTNRPPGMDGDYRFGLRREDGSIEPYPDRAAIDRGALQGRGLEIAWARSKVDVFFAHVQGAARLVYPDGRIRRITYAAKAGHPFSGIGRYLIEIGELDPATVSMQAIRAWLAAHPDRVDEILWHNRSYIFFREAGVADPSSGPVAAAKVPLAAGRSLAVDRLIHTFGFPFFVSSPTLTHLDDGHPFHRLMLALDTGSAIVGPARGDIFTGSGARAGEQAGTIRNPADFAILIPKNAAKRFRS
ncbi:murein transglycosylase A [Rhizobiaceae bacterium BDR2-2]|uniref:peptidoglycan lytic exotransglycosylase n=1 Tax=Ectorhizobium quercum TaxID=2965071 RepID=A0AAE3SWK2_9HYPH|nr:murein transglycosylase A [Ectorhizobium quercum]MCX8999485.1 murein transglycosylase A [Ectorhizobium quercum]